MSKDTKITELLSTSHFFGNSHRIQNPCMVYLLTFGCVGKYTSPMDLLGLNFGLLRRFQMLAASFFWSS